MSIPLSPEEPHITIQTRQGQQTVLARLQGLFPNSASASGPTSAPSTPVSDYSTRGSARSPRFLKIRILTWNMHDSVPKGDLEEILGKVSSYTSPTGRPSFPQFPLEGDHPYHLILVAGQECPSTSGLPMGIGAGFKLIDKDDREKDDKSRSSKYHKEETLKSKKSHDNISYESPHPTSGWTSMIEDWLCYGGSCNRVSSPSITDISIPKRLSPRLLGKEPKRGPYQLLCKERLLGIYLAVYIHRDLRPFVRDTSKSTVTAGLMGGRWGNKGGVGISANIDGSTFLFLNCHLAAQQDKANLHDRLNNFAKIKSELAVDDFLSHDDPRVMAEELTDKFDYTFVFGDLNFRLDISRLHADWLISRQEYAQALAFDQLRNLMVNGRAFVGFHEAPINFPPTFKYDVLRTLKHTKRRGSKLERWRHSSEKVQRLTEVEEKELAGDEEDIDKDSDADVEAEAASLTSSAWTSTHSKHIGDANQDEDYLTSARMTRSASVPGSKVSLSLAVHKAKSKWISLLSPTVPSSPTKWLKSKQSLSEQQQQGSNNNITSSDNLRILVHGSEGNLVTDQEMVQPSIPKLSSINSSTSAQSDDEDDFDDRGVYDSSSKKRVPSWCDRILWKSTVEPEAETEDDDQIDSHSRPRIRVGQFLVNAFRPLSARSRRESYSSMSSNVTSTASSAVSTTFNRESPLPSPDLIENITPFSRSDPLSAESMPENLLPDPKLHRSSSSASRKAERHVRRTSTTPTSAPNPNNGPTDSASMSRWRFLPSFLTHSSTPNNTSEAMTTPGPHKPRKGEVICLNYDTLDDRGMRRLEGRSDHRPVIGSYAVYL